MQILKLKSKSEMKTSLGEFNIIYQQAEKSVNFKEGH